MKQSSLNHWIRRSSNQVINPRALGGVFLAKDIREMVRKGVI